VERALARIDLDALRANCGRLREELGGARLCAVVKANGYGHGAVECARAAIEGGASALAVATAGEAAELAAAGLVGASGDHAAPSDGSAPKSAAGSSDGSAPESAAEPSDGPVAESAAAPGGGSGSATGPVELIVLGALTVEEVDVALGAGAAVAVWTEGFRRLVADRARALGIVARVHVKHDSGMGRLGTFDGDQALALVRAAAADPDLEAAAVWTHLATADEPDDDGGYFFEQLDRFEAVAAAARAELPGLVVHAANSAAVFRSPRSHFDMARCGVALYGLDPFQLDPDARGLAPALSLRSYVAAVKRFPAGQSAGYGRRWRAPEDTWVGVIPLGYGDGVRRALTNDCDVLVGGRRYPLVGTVSMDNLTIDLGPQTEVRPGAEAVLIGRQGDEEIRAEEIAARLGTINYEVTTALLPRVPRRHE
jgi:alanine racemase